MTFDLSELDLDKLREEFAKRPPRKATVLHDIRHLSEDTLAAMLDQNPLRRDYQLKYEQIITDTTTPRTGVAGSRQGSRGRAGQVRLSMQDPTEGR